MPVVGYIYLIFYLDFFYNIKYDAEMKGKLKKVLSEEDCCKYLVKKTTDYLFIMDKKKNKVEVFQHLKLNL